MADECNVSEIVTTFLLNTSRLRQRLSARDVQAAVCCGLTATRHVANDKEAEVISLITGSVAEFYIDPMFPHVGDIDVMAYCSIILAIPRGHPPPIQLPTEFHNYVKVHQIIDTNFPGYVLLELRYLLTQCSDNDRYDYFEYDKGTYLSNNCHRECECGSTAVHGPALTRASEDDSWLLSTDSVICIRCLSWPSQAADWPTRHRNYGWPDSATLDRVVSNGCDVVGVATRHCRQHACVDSKHQWRLSFSRAEIELINSWMPVQQLAYHILRVYVKTERLTESVHNSEPAIMSNYHIKTLMLWVCELRPRSWWTENLNLVRICAELLNILSVWITRTRCCPHYFINNCNLLDTSLSDAVATSKLMSIDETYLTTWLINNYIGRCAQLCPSYISRLFGDIGTGMRLQRVVSEIVRWRLDTSLTDMYYAVYLAEVTIPGNVAHLNVRSCVIWMRELTKIDQRFSLYFSAVVLLHVAREISRNGFNDKLMNILASVQGPNLSQCYSVLSRGTSEQNMSELVELLQKSAVEHLTTYRQLVAPDFGSVVTIVTTDFEAMYAYKRGDYQRCLQLSTQSVHAMVGASLMPIVPTSPDFIQLFDDDIVSLIALMLMVNPQCRRKSRYGNITQMTLSLYLMTQCQLKLHYSVTSLARTKATQRRLPANFTLEQLILKLIERKVPRRTCHIEISCRQS